MISRAVWLAPLALVGLALPPAHQPAAGRDPPATASPERAQFLARLGADRWQAAGVSGRGVTVLIVDSGFRGWHSYLGQVLPSAVLTKSFRTDNSLEARDSCHGVLCGEVIHALAPDAELLFANWESDDVASFVHAVEWGKQHGARVLSCSVIMPCWSDGEGGGPIHAALTRVMGTGEAAGDMLGIACAGNTAQRHWSGRFRRGADGCHEWVPGQTWNAVTPWGEDRVSVELCCPLGAGYAVQVVNTVTGTEIGRAAADPGGFCAVVRFVPTSGARYAVRSLARHVARRPIPSIRAQRLAGALHSTRQHPVPGRWARVRRGRRDRRRRSSGGVQFLRAERGTTQAGFRRRGAGLDRGEVVAILGHVGRSPASSRACCARSEPASRLVTHESPIRAAASGGRHCPAGPRR